MKHVDMPIVDPMTTAILNNLLKFCSVTGADLGGGGGGGGGGAQGARAPSLKKCI